MRASTVLTVPVGVGAPVGPEYEGTVTLVVTMAGVVSGLVMARTRTWVEEPVETKSERVNLVYAAKVDLDGGWNVPLVPGQPAEVTIEAGGTEPGTAK